jgi:hypothetical protein
VSRLVREHLTQRALVFNIVLDDVSITHVAFSSEFTHAVEAKQVAQQTALRAAFLVDQAIQEKLVCNVSNFITTFSTNMDFFVYSPPLSGLREKPKVLS